MYENPDLYNADCMDAMKEFPDKFFDLAIVDPPYGIGILSMQYTKGAVRQGYGSHSAERRDYWKQAQWDMKPDKKYFDELFRVSQKQIIWGGNYFADMIPPSKSFVIWDKRVHESCKNDFADCEYAWLSPGMGVARIYRYLWFGYVQSDMKNKEERFHPTQKPTSLYLWLLDNYAKKGFKILDTHAGSASSLVACHRAGIDGWGFEIDRDYYKQAKLRLDRERDQVSIFELI